MRWRSVNRSGRSVRWRLVPLFWACPALTCMEIDTPFRQQRLRACKPLLTPRAVYPYFLILGIVMIPLGIGFFVSTNRVKEYSVDYTHCNNGTTGAECSTLLQPPNTCQCVVQLTVQEDMDGPVYLYYGLTNFYQNHRRYVKSRDDVQLNGQSLSGSSLCDPITDIGSSAVAPCGLTANSFFNGV
jgi:hypothetical protein